MSWQEEHEKFIEQQIEGYLNLSDEVLMNRFDTKHYSDIHIILKAINRRFGNKRTANIIIDSMSNKLHDRYFLRVHLLELIHQVEPNYTFDVANGNKNELIQKAIELFY